MSSLVSCNKLIMCVLLLVLVACQKSPTGGVIITQEDTGPKHVIVNSVPEPQPAVQPAPQPSVPVAQDPAWIPENVLPQEPSSTVIVIPENKPAEDPVAECIADCESSCKRSAEQACIQDSGTSCKLNCGSIIDPSACSTACSLRSANACEPRFIEYCTPKCTEQCY